MSLKAKIEAVIYASEEPVTLAQLTGLLGHEAQAELDHLDSTQQALALEEAPEQAAPDQAAPDEDELNSEVLANAPGPESQAEAEHAEAIKRHLHEAAAEEAHHAREVRLRTAAATAAMSSADSVEPFLAIFEGATATAEQGIEAPAAGQQEEKDEKKIAREAKEKDRRLRDYFRTILDQLISDYATSDRGLEIREVAGGYRLATKPEYHDAVRGFVKSLKPPLKLSLQALETLAVVAYKQPVTAPEISEIRGVDSGGVLGSLMARKLVTTAGRKQVIGRPILYKTTKDFLLRFGLKDNNELPSIEEFEKMAGELADAELEPAAEGGLTTSEAERSLNEDDEEADAVEGEEIATVNEAG